MKALDSYLLAFHTHIIICDYDNTLIINKCLKLIIRMVFQFLIIISDNNYFLIIKKCLGLIIRITQNSSLVTIHTGLLEENALSHVYTM
jgi:hypothetical protein